MSNTEEENIEVTSLLGDTRISNRPNQRRSNNYISWRGTLEASEVPVASRIYTSASQSSPSNQNVESQSIHDRRGALQAASAVTGQMSLQPPPVVLASRQPLAHQMHTNELGVTSNEPPINSTIHGRFEILQNEVNQLHINIDQQQARIYQLQISIADTPADTEHMQASIDLFLIRINQLKTRVGELQDCIDQFPIRITQLQALFSPYPSSFGSAQARLSPFQIRVDRFKAHIEQLQNNIDRMKAQLHQSQTRVEESQQALLVLQDQRSAPRATRNRRFALFPYFRSPPPPPAITASSRHDAILARTRLHEFLARYQNTASQMRKTVIDNLLQSVDGAWKNVDPCFCGDPYKYLTASGKSHTPARMTNCGHVFGRPCIVHWLKEHDTCPLCRDEVHLPVGDRDSD